MIIYLVKRDFSQTQSLAHLTVKFLVQIMPKTWFDRNKTRCTCFSLENRKVLSGLFTKLALLSLD